MDYILFSTDGWDHRLNNPTINRLESLPLLLVGPILRRVDKNTVTVFGVINPYVPVFTINLDVYNNYDLTYPPSEPRLA